MHQHNYVKTHHHCVACSNCSPPEYICKYNPRTGKKGCYATLSVEAWENMNRTSVDPAQNELVFTERFGLQAYKPRYLQ